LKKKKGPKLPAGPIPELVGGAFRREQLTFCVKLRADVRRV